MPDAVWWLTCSTSPFSQPSQAGDLKSTLRARVTTAMGQARIEIHVSLSPEPKFSEFCPFPKRHDTEAVHFLTSSSNAFLLIH